MIQYTTNFLLLLLLQINLIYMYRYVHQEYSKRSTNFFFWLTITTSVDLPNYCVPVHHHLILNILLHIHIQLRYSQVWCMYMYINSAHECQDVDVWTIMMIISYIVLSLLCYKCIADYHNSYATITLFSQLPPSIGTHTSHYW